MSPGGRHRLRVPPVAAAGARAGVLRGRGIEGVSGQVPVGRCLCLRGGAVGALGNKPRRTGARCPPSSSRPPRGSPWLVPSAGLGAQPGVRGARDPTPGAGVGARQHGPSQAFPRLGNGAQVLGAQSWEAGSWGWAGGLGQRPSPACLGLETETEVAVLGSDPGAGLGRVCGHAGVRVQWCWSPKVGRPARTRPN